MRNTVRMQTSGCPQNSQRIYAGDLLMKQNRREQWFEWVSKWDLTRAANAAALLTWQPLLAAAHSWVRGREKPRAMCRFRQQDRRKNTLNSDISVSNNRRWNGIIIHYKEQDSRAVARKPRDAAAVLFGLKFADNIHYKFNSSQALKAMPQSSKHTGAKQNLMQNGHSRSFKVTCFGVSEKAIRD